jgi:O-antigen/teichoic acid export membrane protein
MVANAFNNLSSLAITLHAARKMGPEKFGQLGLVLAVVAFGVVFLDCGVSVALVRGYNFDSNEANRTALVGGVLKAKLLQAVLISLFAFPLAHALRFFIVETGSDYTLAGGIASAGLMSLWVSVRSLEQARRNYNSFTRYVYLLGVLRFVVYGILLIRGSFSAFSVVACLYLIPLSLLMFYSLVVNERGYLAIHPVRLKREITAVKAAVLYGAWVAGASILFSLTTRLPLFFLARRSTLKELGLFTAAFTFINGFGMIWDALNTVVMPEVSELRTPESRLRFRNLLAHKFPLMISLLALVIVTCVFAQRFLLGPQYRGSISIFLALGVFTAVCMCISLMNNLVHAYGVPAIITGMNVARVIATAIVLISWPHLVALNAAFLYGTVLLSGDLAVLLYVQRRIVGDRTAMSLVTP